MALIFVDGFDHYTDGYELLKWDWHYDVTFGNYGRTGGWGLRFGSYNSGRGLQKVFPEVSGIVTGMAAWLPAYHNAYYFIRLMSSTADTQLSLRALDDGSVAVWSGTSSAELGRSAAGVIPRSTWFYVEVKVPVIDAVAGEVVVRVNEQEVLSLTGVNTDVQATGGIQALRISDIDTGYVYFDDLYICDTTGSVNNDFLGDVQITTLHPTSDGAHQDFATSVGTDHFQLVADEPLANQDDFLWSSVSGATDTMGVENFTSTGQIFGVQVTAAVKNQDTGFMSVRPVCRSGTVPADNEGAERILTQDVRGAQSIWEKEPTDNVGWTADKVNNAEFGVKVV